MAKQITLKSDLKGMGTGVSYGVADDGRVIMAFDPNADYGLTAGKIDAATGQQRGGGNTRVATTHGNSKVPEFPGLRVSINAYKVN